jgi:hypothetical protein
VSGVSRIVRAVLVAGAAIVVIPLVLAAAPGVTATDRLASGGSAAAALAEHGSAGPLAPAVRLHGPPPVPGAHPVVLIGFAGLHWADVSAAATPAIWQLARQGSVGSLVDTTIGSLTCPADAWLTLNAGARSAVPRQSPDRCRLARVLASGLPGSSPGPAVVPGMAGLEQVNTAYGPYRWGTLRRAAGPAGCATAAGPGAGLALASRTGQIAGYLAQLPAAGLPVLRRCPLAVLDLGPWPAAAGPAAVIAADRQVAAIRAAAAPGSIVVLAGLGDPARQQLRLIIVAGPGFRRGLLTSASTRQPGVVTITDLTTASYAWRHQRPPARLAGAVLQSAARGPLPAAIRTLIGQDTAEQVYRHDGWVLLGFGAAAAALLALIAVAFRHRRAGRLRSRAAGYTAVAVLVAAVPAGTFLAGLLPWAGLPHPALVFWAASTGWAALIAAAALAGPWRRDAFGPPGVVAAVTFGIIAGDLVTGSRLQPGTPFGLSLLEGNRFYGLGNNALGIYATAGLVAAAWAAVAARRDGHGHPERAAGRRAGCGQAGGGRAVAACCTVAAAAIIGCGWPGFGAKVGGTIAIVPAFGVLIAAAAGVRFTRRRLLAIAVSGLLLAAAFAVLNYLRPVTGISHQGTFVWQLLHGHDSAAATLRRKISTNLQSLTASWFAPLVPAAVVATGVLLAVPGSLRLQALVRAQRAEPMLRPLLAAIWLAAVLGWLADDTGLRIPAVALSVALPLAIALVARIAAEFPDPAGQRQAPAGAAGSRHPPQWQRGRSVRLAQPEPAVRTGRGLSDHPRRASRPRPLDPY